MGRKREYFAKNKGREQWEGKFHDLHPLPGKFLLKKLCTFEEMEKMIGRAKDPETRRSEILMDLYIQKEKEILKEEGDVIEVTGPTLLEATEIFMRRKERTGVTTDTLRCYHYACENLKRAIGPARRLQTIDNTDAEALVDYLDETCQPTTVRTRLTHCKTFFKWCSTRWDFTPPVFEKYHVPKREPDPYEIDEWKVMVKYCRENGKKNLERLLMVQGLTGMRVKEIWKLTLEQMGEVITADTKGQQLDVKKVVPEALSEFVQQDIAERGDRERYWLDKGDGRRAYADQNAIIKAVKNICDTLGISRRMPTHGFRSMFITELLANNVSLGVVQGIAGHSQPQTTMRYTKTARLRNTFQNAVDNLSKKMSIVE